METKDKISVMRSRTRTIAFLVLLITLCALAVWPASVTIGSMVLTSPLNEESKNILLGGLLGALGTIIVFYFSAEQ